MPTHERLRDVSESGQLLRSQIAERIAIRDGLRTPDQGIVIAVVAQVQSTWATAESVVQSLSDYPQVQVEVVAIDSAHEVREVGTADFLRGRGFTPRSVDWLDAAVADVRSGLGAVIFYDPWDGLRPNAAGANHAVLHGVRTAYLPYSPNAAAGHHMEELSYNLGIHQVAWRIYAFSETQRSLFGDHCRTGSAHVRVLGTPRFDRVGRTRTAVPAEWESALSGRRVFLWNPHFNFGKDGWSTFLDYLEVLAGYVAKRRDVCLLIRPHFRLLRDLASMGQEGAGILEFLMGLSGEHDNIIIDTLPDYLPSFEASEALISDLSSLVTEYFLTGKPLLYLHRETGPGLNADASYFLTCDVATQWSQVREFIDAVLRDPAVGSARRGLAMERYFALEDGRASERVAADIVASITEEWKSVPPLGATELEVTSAGN